MANRRKLEQWEDEDEESVVNNKKRKIMIRQAHGFPIIDMGTTELWDGADVARLRITIHQMFVRGGLRKIGIDMTHVQYLPSGLFGMLCDWVEKQVTILLMGPPTPRVAHMLWFRLCCEQYDMHEGISQLFSKPLFAYALDDDSANGYAEEEPDGMLEAV